MNWLKWHVGTFTDPKFAVIAKKAGQPKHAVLAVWAALLETACNGEKRGDVSSFHPEDIGIALDLEPEAVMAIFGAIMARGMVTDERLLAAWDKRQTQDYSTDRVRKYREKAVKENQSAPASETHETRSTVSETPGNAEENRGEEKRKEKKEDSDICALAVGLWNDLAEQSGLSAVQRLNDGRRSKLLQRLRECGGVEGWGAALAKVRDSPFLCGQNRDGWRADFDFILRRDKFTKLMEGGYDGQRNNFNNGFAQLASESGM